MILIFRRWLKEAEDDDGHAFIDNGTLTPEQAEIRRLKEQVKRLEIECDIFKKRRFDKRNVQMLCYVNRASVIWS